MPVAVHGGIDGVVGQAVQLQREEEQARRHVRQLGLDVAEKLAVRRIGHVGIIGQTGIGGDATEQVFQRIHLAQRLGKRAVAHRFQRAGELALPLRFERQSIGTGLVDRAEEFR